MFSLARSYSILLQSWQVLFNYESCSSPDGYNTNIILTITKESGWIDFDLSKYNIVLKGDVALTLEWVKVIGINKNRAQKINNKITTEYVLFNTKKNQGYTYTRWGTEAKWTMHENGSPSIYLIIQ